MGEFLKNNAIDFFDEAESDMKKGKWNLAMFHLEQALQLSLKYTLFIFTGSFPKTHDIKDLLRHVINVTNNEKLMDIMKNESVILDLLVQAYIASRYVPASYSEETVKKVYEVVKLIMNELGLLSSK